MRYDQKLNEDFNVLLKKIATEYAYAFKGKEFKKDFDYEAMSILFNFLAENFENADDELSELFSELAHYLSK